MKMRILLGTLVAAAVAVCTSAADNNPSTNCPPNVVFLGLGQRAPQTPEQFDEAARKYVAARKVSFSVVDAAKKLVVHISNTNTPVCMEYWHELHYLQVQFDREGSPVSHKQGIQYVR